MRNDFKKFSELYKNTEYEEKMKQKMRKEYDADYKKYVERRDAYNAKQKGLIL